MRILRWLLVILVVAGALGFGVNRWQRYQSKLYPPPLSDPALRALQLACNDQLQTGRQTDGVRYGGGRTGQMPPVVVSAGPDPADTATQRLRQAQRDPDRVAGTEEDRCADYFRRLQVRRP